MITTDIADILVIGGPSLPHRRGPKTVRQVPDTIDGLREAAALIPNAEAVVWCPSDCHDVGNSEYISALADLPVLLQSGGCLCLAVLEAYNDVTAAKLQSIIPSLRIIRELKYRRILNPLAEAGVGIESDLRFYLDPVTVNCDPEYFKGRVTENVLPAGVVCPLLDRNEGVRVSPMAEDQVGQALMLHLRYGRGCIVILPQLWWGVAFLSAGVRLSEPGDDPSLELPPLNQATQKPLTMRNRLPDTETIASWNASLRYRSDGAIRNVEDLVVFLDRGDPADRLDSREMFDFKRSDGTTVNTCGDNIRKAIERGLERACEVPEICAFLQHAQQRWELFFKSN